MAPISTNAQPFLDKNNEPDVYTTSTTTTATTALTPFETSSTGGTHHTITLSHTPFRNLSIWVYIAIAVIILVLVAALFHVVYSCYRSATVGGGKGSGTEGTDEEKPMVTATRKRRRTTEAMRRQGRVDEIGGGQRNVRGVQKQLALMTETKTKRRGVVVLSEKAIMDLDEESGRQRRSYKLSFQTGRENWWVMNVSGDSVVKTSSLSTTAVVEDFSDGVTEPKLVYQSPMTRRPRAVSCSTTAKSESQQAAAEPFTPMQQQQQQQYYDTHNIRFVMPKESSRIWSDPKLSPVGGSIIQSPPATAHPSSTLGAALGSSGETGYLSHGRRE
ncbi:hypothetical protein AMATHDRAFT_4052 [Amanita thiersii Skay4041]|uniref:Uncharacterized protein n=1 Tax=Amanita thiersii Skay4041 TaxID=703135 RepID=A0A2A9NRD3_9AGAR|nr:hypothetical protein AMATHDRAFT_4052 [Amanita thiersii Skay4041]